MKIIVAVTGASGALYAQRLFDKLHTLCGVQDTVSVVFSETAKQVWQCEIGAAPRLYTFTEYSDKDFFAPLASGSALYDAMVVCPCSMGTLGRIAHGILQLFPCESWSCNALPFKLALKIKFWKDAFLTPGSNS